MLIDFACIEPVRAAVDASGDTPFEQRTQERWALQVGYYIELRNAQNFKQRLLEAGYEALILAEGRPGEQRYRLIAGWADAPEDFTSLQNELQDTFGARGFAIRNPYEAAAPLTAEPNDDPFEQSRPRVLLAQAGEIQPMGGESVGSAANRPTEAAMFLATQEEVDSIPGFTAGGLQIVPTLGLSIGIDDNVTLASANEIDSAFYIISPAVLVELPSDHSVLSLTGAIDFIRFEDSAIDDREPWYVRGNWAWDASTRQDFNLYAQYGEGSDRRGTGRRQGDAGLIPLEPDEWKRFDYGGLWRYGSVGARGRLDLLLGGSKLEYTNNRERTVFLDRDWWFGGGTFYWRVAPRTSFLANFLYTDIDYTVADTDSEETSWMLGLTWDATARTGGRISYGKQEKDFKNPELVDYDGPTWLASISWRPRTYSLFTLTGTRRSQEPDGNADFVVRQDITLSWIHDWATRFGTVVDVGLGEDEYRPDVRTDDLFYWSVGARYQFNMHFRFGASVRYYERDSGLDEFSYNQFIYMLTLEASF